MGHPHVGARLATFVGSTAWRQSPTDAAPEGVLDSTASACLKACPDTNRIQTLPQRLKAAILTSWYCSIEMLLHPKDFCFRLGGLAQSAGRGAKARIFHSLSVTAEAVTYPKAFGESVDQKV